MPHSAAAPREEVCDRRPRVLIVDDSAVARAVTAQLVVASGRFAVAGEFPGVAAALAFLASARVDIILLDIAMPGVDGLTALPNLLLAGKGARIVIVSSSAEDGTVAAVQALALGAADTLVKPHGGAGGTAAFRIALLAKLDRLVEAIKPVATAPTAPPHPLRSSSAVGSGQDAYDVVAIGASTGGIHALGQLLGALPAEFRLPILITQHLPASFMPYFAAQLAVMAKRPADVATDRMRLRPGRVVVAPGDAHVRVVSIGGGGAAIRLSNDPAPSGCAPSVDPMLASIAEVYGARGLGIILSGMGRDGAEGARALHDVGGCVLAQDQASSVVWGMPGAVASIADAVLPPLAIGALVAMRRRP